MDKYEDFTGMTFFRWKVIGKYPSKNKRTMWLCKCECGVERPINASNLKRGLSKSCGCLNAELKSIRNKSIRTDLGGMTFGRLEVIRPSDNKNNASCWECSCECGNIVFVRASHLKDGRTVSCGCLRESYVASELKKYYCKENFAIKEYKVLKNPETGYYLPFDIYIPNKNIFIEVNGEQHYRFVNKWHRNIEKFEERKKFDRMKRKYARKNGVYIEIDLRKIKTTEQAIEKINKIIKETSNHGI